MGHLVRSGACGRKLAPRGLVARQQLSAAADALPRCRASATDPLTLRETRLDPVPQTPGPPEQLQHGSARGEHTTWMTKARRRRTNTRGAAVDIKSAETAVASLYRSHGAPAAGPPLRRLAVRSPRRATPPTHRCRARARAPADDFAHDARMGCRPCGFGALTRTDDRDVISRGCCPRPAGDAFLHRPNADEVTAAAEDDVVRVADGKPVHDAGGCLDWHSSPLAQLPDPRGRVVAAGDRDRDAVQLGAGHRVNRSRRSSANSSWSS